MPRGAKATRLGDTTEQVAGPIRALIADLEHRLETLTDPELRTPLEAQLDEQHRQLDWVLGNRRL